MKATPAPLQFGEPDHGRMAEAGVGQYIEIRLPENPTTGFRWQIIGANPSVCALVDDTFESGHEPGQPGIHCWRFQTVAAGLTAVELVYRRAWESDMAAPRAFSLHLKVRPAGSSRSRPPAPGRSRTRKAK